jgi:phospholipid transport system substrate-binding protein
MHSWYGRIIGSVLVGGLLLAGHVRHSEAGEPLDKVKVTVDDVVAILANKTLQLQERHAKIRQAVLQRFSFDEMAQRALAQHWRTLTPPQRQEFVGLFTDLLEGSYINRIANSNPGSQSVRYVKETIEHDQAAVHTEIGNERDAPATVEYRLLHKEGDWKVYDIVIEGVSLVNNYRTQFNTIITKDSYAGLVKQMRLKRDQENAVSGQKG